ncbi:MAG TPA: SdiA-regulated domain-containing protein [Gemmatimonadales bacterium]|nr:SdiA-regulated domain-containing protein [Gemmatimonadales bacterium]
MRSIPSVLAVAAIACGADTPRPSPEFRVAAMNAEAPRRSRLAACAPEPDGRWALPDALAEASGLAWETDAVLSHGDERGIVYRVTPAGGAVVAATLAGEPRDDFEGIALAGGRLVLSTSAGRLYLADWPAAGPVAAHRVVETELGRDCELEGLAWDAAAGALLLPCKQSKGRSRREGVAVRRWHLDRGAPLPDIAISAGALEEAGLRSFRPSAIEVDSVTGNWLLLSANPPALLEVSPAGAVVRAAALDSRHRQPEGLALTPAGHLLIADEAAGGTAQLSRYRCPLQ